ncbi:hypothetical protein RJ639_033410 [Escallonia herrerae]|uniref:Uncharacterized protein n=1 Tax=Escallonia herrerae TaxID=1293975 RepID=A0AA88X2I3_9ASTE|nr:hypothetical protein RJ639_033410 [Escallonia herrerae]
MIQGFVSSGLHAWQPFIRSQDASWALTNLSCFLFCFVERGELHKDIEQLCMQHAGPSYLSVATRMHFQRTAGLEQEIEDLRKKLAACVRENLNFQEELEEAYRIKSQLADLHSVEVSKGSPYAFFPDSTSLQYAIPRKHEYSAEAVLSNMEAEKQVKFFQSSVAAAFAERDHSIMEAEKAKEKEEFMSEKLNDFRKRVEELTSDCWEEKKLSAALRVDLEKQEKQNETFRKVIMKFYEIRQHSVRGSDDASWEDKCESLLRDSEDMWSFNDYGESSTSKYIAALEEEVDMLRNSVGSLENQLRMGLEIEKHLKKKVGDMEKLNIFSQDKMKKEISGLLHLHSQHRVHIVHLLDNGYSHLKSTIDVIEDKIRQLDMNGDQNLMSPRGNIKLQESECRDVHINNDAGSNLCTEMSVPDLTNRFIVGTGDAPEALSQALQEKVAALLLLSQQEERYLLESNVNAALQKKVEELQRNLLQVANEKVKALMELAQLKQKYQLLQEYVCYLVAYLNSFIEICLSICDLLKRNICTCNYASFNVLVRIHGHSLWNISQKQGKLSAYTGEQRTVQAGDGRLKNMLKKTYLRRWIDPLVYSASEAKSHLNHEGNTTNKRSYSDMDFARMRIENASLKESLENMEHLTSTVHRLRVALLEVKDVVMCEETVSGKSALDNIVTEAKLVKTALGSSLPVSWSAETDLRSSGEFFEEAADVGGDSSTEKGDRVSAAGFEMVELLILAAEILTDNINRRDCSNID